MSSVRRQDFFNNVKSSSYNSTRLILEKYFVYQVEEDAELENEVTDILLLVSLDAVSNHVEHSIESFISHTHVFACKCSQQVCNHVFVLQKLCNMLSFAAEKIAENPKSLFSEDCLGRSHALVKNFH